MIAFIAVCGAIGGYFVGRNLARAVWFIADIITDLTGG